MKILIPILFIFFSLTAVCQPWRDSLEVARSAYKKGDYGRATRYYESAQKKAPEGVDLSDEMAQSSYKAREFEKAEKIYQQSASSKKSAKEKAKSYHNLGNSRLKKKDYQGAIESYKESLRNDPKNEKTRYNLSEAIRRLKEEQRKEEEQNQKNQKDQNDQNDQNDQKGQNNNQNKDQGKNSQNNQSGQQKGQPNGQNGSKPKNGGDKKGNNDSEGGKNKKSGKTGNSDGLPNKVADRMLDDLMKAEAATKRKIGGNQNGSSSTHSGKDW